MRKSALLLFCAVAVLLFASAAMADNLVPSGTWVKPYPDYDLSGNAVAGGNTSRLDGLPTTANPWYFVNGSPPVSGTVGLWCKRDPYWADNDMGYQGDSGSSPLPSLTQVVTGLDPSRQYEVDVLYWNYAATLSAKMDADASYTHFNGSNPNTTVLSGSASDGAFQSMLGTVSGVTSYKVDIEGNNNQFNTERWIGTAYIDIGPAPNVPEPSTLVLLATGLLGLLAYAWRKRR